MRTHCGGRNRDKIRNRISTPVPLLVLEQPAAVSSAQGRIPGELRQTGRLRDLGRVYVGRGDLRGQTVGLPDLCYCSLLTEALDFPFFLSVR